MPVERSDAQAGAGVRHATAGGAELIEMRPDERLAPERLEPYLRGRLPRAKGVFELKQFAGGHANLTYLVRFGETEYVLRRPPLGPVAKGAHDMRREHRVLAALSRVFDLAPASYLHCADPAVAGAEFHVMERRHGIVIRKDLPPAAAGQIERNRRLGEMIVDVLARLHRVDAEIAGLGDLGRPDGFVERQLDGWSRRWSAAADRDYSRMRSVLSWLERTRPQSHAAALLHNDFKLDNLLVDAADPATPVAVLDWDMCTRGDPLMDLGYLLGFWGEAGDDPAWLAAASMPTFNAGFPDREEVVSAYAARTGFDVGHAHWYHVFGIFKLAVIIAQIYIRYLRGQTSDRRFAVFGERVAALVDKADAMAGNPQL